MSKIRTDHVFTSESVSEGHPDKVCDIISDSILDAIIAQDPMGRVACETFATTGLITVMGEMSFNGNVDYSRIVRKAVKDIGYDSREAGFDGDSCGVLLSIDEQSPDIAMGVNAALEKRDGATDELASTGAGDQGMMFGYACSETDSLMPAPIEYAHRLTRRLAALRKDGTLPFLRPLNPALSRRAPADTPQAGFRKTQPALRAVMGCLDFFIWKLCCMPAATS